MSPEAYKHTGVLSEWTGRPKLHDFTGFTRPVESAIYIARNLAGDNPDLGILTVPIVPDSDADQVAEWVRELLGRKYLIAGEVSVGADYSRLPDGLRMTAVSYGPEFFRILENNPEGLAFAGRKVADATVMLSPIILTGMDFAAFIPGFTDYGLPVGTMYGWAAIKASWIEPKGREAGCLRVDPTYGLVRVWSEDTLFFYPELAADHEGKPLIPWVLDKWEQAKPIEINTKSDQDE